MLCVRLGLIMAHRGEQVAQMQGSSVFWVRQVRRSDR
jgi:hypothetical protein